MAPYEILAQIGTGGMQSPITVVLNWMALLKK
jgi:hypothetical protein